MDSKTQDLSLEEHSNNQQIPSVPQDAHSDEHGQAGPDGRLIHIYYEGMNYDHARVVDSDKATVLYTADFRIRKPHMTMHNASNGEVIATTICHSLTGHLDMTIHDRPIALNPHGLRQLNYSYDSPAMNDVKLMWKSKGWLHELDMVLLDDKAMPVARFLPVNWSVKKGGKIELLEPCNNSQALMDEVVATGVAIMAFKHFEYLSVAVR